MIFRKTMFLTASILFIAAICLALHAQPSNAVVGSDWLAGNIVNDSTFTNRDSMNVSQIQSFLNNKVPVCDTWGTGGNGTRAEYGASHNNPVPFTCLKDYYEVPKTSPGPGIPANNYGKAIPVGAKSAAQIIWDAAQQYNISPKVLLVKLGTESAGPLTSDDWPFLSQYTYAMGSHCPDTGPGGSANCDTDYAGFSIQMYSAASLLRWYLDNMTQSWWSYKKPYQTNYVLWNTTQSKCGGSNVNITNKATAALYTYTPYQPNQAALNNMYGTGDGCSAYGNRNFWRTYSDWFGSTQGGDPVSTELRISSPITINPAQPVPGETATISYTVQNYSDQNITYDLSLIQCRFNTTSNCDFGTNGSDTINAGESKTFLVNTTVGSGGVYSLVPFFLQGGVWYRFGNESVDANYVKLEIPDVRITSPIQYSPTDPVIGQPITISFNIKNFGTTPTNIQTSVIQCRLNILTSCDSNYGGSTTLNPGNSMKVEYSATPPDGGDYTIVPYFYENNTWFKYNKIGDSYANSISTNISDMRLTSPITISPAQPIPGQTATITYTVKNFGTTSAIHQTTILQCRNNVIENCDSEYGSEQTIASGDSYTFSQDVKISNAGNHIFTPFFLENNIWRKYTKAEASNNYLSIIAPSYVADMQLTSPISISPAKPIPGQNATVTYTVKNFGDLPAYFQDSVLQCRLNSSINCDADYDGEIIIEPGASQTFSKEIYISQAGQYNIIPYYRQNNAWHKYNGTYNNIITSTVLAYLADVRLTGPIVINPSNPTVGQTGTVSYTIQNYGTLPAILQNSVLQCRVNIIKNCDSNYSGKITIEPGESRTFAQDISITLPGQYSFTPYFMQNNNWYKFTKATYSNNTLSLMIN